MKPNMWAIVQTAVKMLAAHNPGGGAKPLIYFFAVCIVIVGGVITLEAADYKWALDTSDWHSWGDSANWVDSSGNHVTAYPSSAEDNIDVCDYKKQMFDLDNTSYTIGKLTEKTWRNGVACGFRNGNLTFSAGTTKFATYSTITITNATVTFDTGSTVEFGVDYSSGVATDIRIQDGGCLEIFGGFNARVSSIDIADGGVFRWGNTAKAKDANANKDWCIYNRGTLDWPNGFRSYNSAWSFRPLIRQYDGGEWILGDELKYNENIYFRIELHGGAVLATNNVAFKLRKNNEYDAAYAKFMPDAEVTINVADGFTVDMATSSSTQVPFSYEPGEDGTNYTKITRTGAGALLLADVPYSLDLQSGTTIFSANSRTAMGTLNVGSGQSFAFANVGTTLQSLDGNAGVITIAKPGLTVGALAQNATLTGAFVVPVAAFNQGEVIVSTPSAALRAKIKADIAAEFEDAGVGIVESGDELVVGAPTYIFDSTTVTDLNDPAGWQNGLPVAGKDVVVSGVGVHAVVTANLTNVWNSITVQDGAVIEIAATGLEVPGIVLKGTGSMLVSADFSMPSVSCSTIGVDFPTLTVATGATLTVPAGQKFGNVRIILCDGSSLRAASDGSLVFGYAANGETAYFAMCATNATIAVTNSLAAESGASAYNGLARIDFASPAVGGRVVVPEPIVLKNINFERGYATEGHYIYDGFAFGLNNPEDEAVKVVIDNSFVIFGEHSWVAGGVNLVMTNNAVLCRSIFPDAETRRRTDDARNEGDKTDNWFNLHINDLAVLTLVDGGELRMGVGPVNGEKYSGLLSLSPSMDGHAGVEVLEGGIGCWYKSNGQQHKDVYNNQWADPVTHAHKGSVRFADGVMDVFKDYWWGYGNRSHIFYNMAAVNVAGGTTMTIRCVPDKLATNWQHIEAFEVESPFSGGGDVVVTNAWDGKTMCAIVTSGKNACTGTIYAADCEGTAAAGLYMADGANWAGTVVANGRMSLVDASVFSGDSIVTSTGAVAVAFGALDLQADFPVRIWKTGDAVTTNDVLNVGSYINNGGKLVPTLVGEGEFAIGDEIVLGTINKTGTSPRLPAGWLAKRVAIDGDDAHERLIAKRGIGLQVIVR